MSIAGKKILFFSVSFFGYELAIAEKLRSLGAEVFYFDERPSNTVLAKGLIRLNPSYLNTKIQKYYEKILHDTSTIKFDYIFIIKGEVIPVEVVEQFKIRSPQALAILYLWDSLANNDNAVELLTLMDKSFSFNEEDCTKTRLQFRPLFFLDEYALLKSIKYEYDLLFICTAHTDRYKLGKSIEERLLNEGRSMCGYYYLESPIVYLYKKLFEPEFKNVNYHDLSFKSLSKTEMLEYYIRSMAILDVQHPKQQGLTIRSIESVGAGKKLITTNASIRNYDFYDANNIMVIDRQDPKLDLAFFETPYQPIDQEIINYYSLEGWIKTIFSVENN